MAELERYVALEGENENIPNLLRQAAGLIERLVSEDGLALPLEEAIRTAAILNGSTVLLAAVSEHFNKQLLAAGVEFREVTQARRVDIVAESRGKDGT